MAKLKVGIAGSSSMIKEREKRIARELGRVLGRSGHQIFFCFDKDSLPLLVCKEARKFTDEIICFTTNEEEAKLCKEFLTIVTGMSRMVREYIFIKNIDLLLVLGGGSGTLMEVTFAYQMNKPIYLIEEVRSSVDVFKGKFIDKRKRVRIKPIKLKEIKNILLKAK